MKDIINMEKLIFSVRYKFSQAHNFETFCDNRATDSTEKSQPRNVLMVTTAAILLPRMNALTLLHCSCDPS